MSDSVEKSKRQKFIESYWEAVENNVPERIALEIAHKEAGYGETYTVNMVLKHLDQELLDHANMELKLGLPKAISKLKKVLDDPDNKGAANVIAASASILDRAGVLKKEAKEVTVTMPTGIAFMPAKLPVQIDADVLSEESESASDDA